MVRLVMYVSVSAIAIVSLFPVFDSSCGGTLCEVMSTTSPRFHVRLEAGADCFELIAVRDTYDPSSPEVQRMNDELGAIGCDSAASIRIH